MSLGGWIKLHRALADHPVASDPNSLAVWIHILMLANHKETKRQINGQIVTLKAGQLITSRKSISEKTGVQESKVERVLKMLKSEQQIEQVGTAKFRVISIVNWCLYQGDEQVEEQQANNRRTADEQQANTPGEVLRTEECKEDKEGDSSSKSTRRNWVSELVALGVDKKHAKDWLAVRKQKRAAMTDTALEQVMQEAEKAGITVGEAIHIAASNSWQGFKASWLNKTATNGSQALAKHTGFADRDYHQGLFEKEDGSYGF